MTTSTARTRMSRLRTLAALGVAGAAAFSAPREAQACGGFFCSRTPVDQTAEHILFTVNDDHTVSAYVQIKYTGDKDSFAWIVPAPGTPKLTADFPNLALQALDTGTQPQYFKNSCQRGVNFGLAPSGSAKSEDSAGVTVLAVQAVGPFNTVTLEGTSADVIVKWLQDNGYRITDNMIPLLQPYVEGGMHFVAVKLQADKTTADIQPLGMTYDGDKPMIPIRLTAVAAQPEMGIVTWILANQRWAPENYVNLKIPDKLIEFDQYGYQNNYLTLVSRESDKVGGQAFVTEYAKSTADLLQQVTNQSVGFGNPDADKARDALLPLLQKFPYITRLYARMSAEEMTEDPQFMVSSDHTDVNNVHDLTVPGFDGSMCGTPPPLPAPSPCAFAYCGRSGVCVETLPTVLPGMVGDATTAACVCANVATARATMTNGGQPAMYCEPVAMNLDTAGASGSLVAAACEGFDCGMHGSCVAMNGNPTCQCEGGYGAVASQAYDQTTGVSSTKVTCEKVAATTPPFPVLPKIGQAQITPDRSGSQDSGGCSVALGSSRGTGNGTRGAFLFASLAIAAGWRKRQARRA
jgi:hypothetical protein